SMRSTPIGGRPFPGFGYTGSMRAHSSRHGTTRSISARNCARRVVFVYFSKPVPTSVSCERLFISTSRSHVMWLAASQHNIRESGSLLQRFPKRETGRVFKGHSRFGSAPPVPNQRHSRPLEDRGRADGAGVDRI